jgi:hypothetical protein
MEVLAGARDELISPSFVGCSDVPRCCPPRPPTATSQRRRVAPAGFAVEPSASWSTASSPQSRSEPEPSPARRRRLSAIRCVDRSGFNRRGASRESSAPSPDDRRCWTYDTSSKASAVRTLLTVSHPTGLVGKAGFEPATPCSQSRCASQAAPLPVAVRRWSRRDGRDSVPVVSRGGQRAWPASRGASRHGRRVRCGAGRDRRARRRCRTAPGTAAS